MLWTNAFFCLNGLNLISDSCYVDDLLSHKDTSCGDYLRNSAPMSSNMYSCMQRVHLFLETMMKIISPDRGNMQQGQCQLPSADRLRTNTSDKWSGFVLTKEGEEFVEQNANLFKCDLLHSPQQRDSCSALQIHMMRMKKECCLISES